MRNGMVGLFIVLAGLALLPSGEVVSQGAGACPAIVQFALDTTDAVCRQVGENQICYGHVLVDATPRLGVQNLSFEQEGDTAPLVDVEAIRLSPMNMELGTWGVALLSLQAYLQYAEPENVTFILFGDVELENTSEMVTSIPVRIRANEFVNARLYPASNAGVIETLLPGQTLAAKGRVADGSWIRAVLPATGRVGWVDARYVVTDGDLMTLDVVDQRTPYYGPMQAFYYRSGVEDSLCPESPESGMLIQTPEGVAEVTLLVNEVSIDMRATAFVQAQPGQSMTFGVLDGWAEVTVDGRRQPVFAGTQVSIPLGEDLAAVGPASAPQPYDPGKMATLPVAMLDTSVAIAPPPSESDLVALVSAWDNRWTALVTADIQETDGDISAYYVDQSGVVMLVASDGTTSPAEVLDDGTVVLPPGLDGIAPPGMGGENPGQGGGTPPGQAKND